jgi:hypothetical protein
MITGRLALGIGHIMDALNRLDLIDDAGDENRMVGDEHPSGSCNDVRFGNVLLPADALDHPDDVVANSCSVDWPTTQAGLAAVVVDARSATDVEMINIDPHLADLGVDACGSLTPALTRLIWVICEPMWKWSTEACRSSSAEHPDRLEQFSSR